MNNYRDTVINFADYLYNLNTNMCESELTLNDYLHEQVNKFLIIQEPSSLEDDDFDIQNVDDDFEYQNHHQHFYNLIYFIDENKPQKFREYLDKILSYIEGKNILDIIFKLDNKQEITGYAEQDDLTVTPYGLIIFYTIDRMRIEIFQILLEYNYPLYFTQDIFEDGKGLNVIEYIIYQAKQDSEYYRMIYSINFIKNKTSIINDNLDLILYAIKYGEECGNAEAIEILEKIYKYKDTTCIGCIEEQFNQIGHTSIGGCMYDPEYS